MRAGSLWHQQRRVAPQVCGMGSATRLAGKNQQRGASLQQHWALPYRQQQQQQQPRRMQEHMSGAGSSAQQQQFEA